jgi:hypothetical protein
LIQINGSHAPLGYALPGASSKVAGFGVWEEICAVWQRSSIFIVGLVVILARSI